MFKNKDYLSGPRYNGYHRLLTHKNRFRCLANTAYVNKRFRQGYISITVTPIALFSSTVDIRDIIKAFPYGAFLIPHDMSYMTYMMLYLC